jgi:NitT/TauT family transport system substrate-binding protein
MRTRPALLLLALAVAACGKDAGQAAAPDAVRLQLKWVTQAQFAGYYAALEQGYYADENLAVEILEGGPDLVPEDVVLARDAELGVGWLDQLLAERDQGAPLVNIAQVFARSGMTELTWKDSGIDRFTKLRGKKVGVWLGGNEHKLFAALVKAGIDPFRDVELVRQEFDMKAFLAREIDAAAAMTYNELAQVLEAADPATGELWPISALNVFRMSDLGTGELEDGVFVRADWLAEANHKDIAIRFLRATFKGWIFCRDHAEECLRAVLDRSPQLGEGHQRWQLNEVNKLIWPNALGIGVMNPADFTLTNEIARQYGIIRSLATSDAYVTTLAEEATASLKADGEDVTGAGWLAPEVPIAPGGRSVPLR